MKQASISLILKTVIVLLGVFAFCGFDAYADGVLNLAMLVTPGCLLMAWGLYQLDESFFAALHKRYKVVHRNIRMAAGSSGPMRAA